MAARERVHVWLARWRARRRVRVRCNWSGFQIVYIDCSPFGICEGSSDYEPVESIVKRAVDYVLTEKPPRPWEGWRYMLPVRIEESSDGQ